MVFYQPIWKNMNVHLDHVPQVRGWNIKKIHPGRLTAGTYKSPMKRKENDLNQTSMFMVHVNLPGCIWNHHLVIFDVSKISQPPTRQRTWIRRRQAKHLHPTMHQPRRLEPSNDHSLNHIQKLGCPVGSAGKWLVNGLFHLLIKWSIPWGYNPLILTIDTKFLKHPSIPPGDIRKNIDF